MEIRLNGERHDCEGPMTVDVLLTSLGVSPGTIVVEINRRICPRERIEYETVSEGDEVEVIRLVGGG